MSKKKINEIDAEKEALLKIIEEQNKLIENLIGQLASKTWFPSPPTIPPYLTPAPPQYPVIWCSVDV